jgi:hypothetical protein
MADASKPDARWREMERAITSHLDYCLETGDRFDAKEEEARAAYDVILADLSFEAEDLRNHPVVRVARYAATHGTSGNEGVCVLLREIAGNRFRRTMLDPVWLMRNNSTVATLTGATYEGSRYLTVFGHRANEKPFDLMPIVADALEEAGCTSQDILQHCRSGGEFQVPAG